jgi:uncharacterized repeat protein (TIGR03843 family)
LVDGLEQALLHGEIDLKGQFLLGSNYTFLVTVRYQQQELPAVYKPERGQQTLWDFPAASLARREVAAYLVSQALGFGFVPVTVLRQGPFGAGSLQQYIDHNPNLHYFSFKPADRQRLRPVVLFDLLVNNADRKGSHILLQKRTRKLFLIDHGLCFHEEDKLRTVIWDFVGENLPEELVTALETFQTLLHQQLSSQLQPYLSLAEIDALEARLEALLTRPVFPAPPEDRRAFPYPPL